MKNIIFVTALAIVSSLFNVQVAEADAAGTILLASGEVAITDANGKQTPARVGMIVESGQSLVTQNGRAQVQFTDGGFISLQPSTEFKISNYHHAGAENQTDSAVFDLVKGGLRAITGVIGKANRQAYQLNTPMASIGIRGTEYQAVICAASCKQPDGLYVRTGEGIIFVKNPAGEIDVGAGNSAYVASINSAPQHTTNAPAINAQQSSPVVGPEKLPGVANTGEFSAGLILTTPTIPGVFTILNSAGLGFAGSGTVTGSFSGSLFGSTFDKAGSVSGVGAGAGAGTNTASGVAVGVYLNGNEVAGATISANNVRGKTGFVTVVPSSVKNASADGGLYWGRWTNTTINGHAGFNTVTNTETLTLDSNSSIAYILGTSVPTIPVTGSSTYSFIGGTPSTDQSGMVGLGITGGTLTANFSSLSVGANLTINHGGVYTLSATMPFSSNSQSFSSQNSGGSASTSGAGTYSAAVSGFFAGTNAPTAPSRAGVTYDIQKPANGIVGVGAFKCSTGC
jgi:hypothetical protein